RLIRAGVGPKEAQTLARHSTISLTMDRYTHLGLHDVAAAVGQLPSLTPAPDHEVQSLRATGTDRISCTASCTNLALNSDSERSEMTTDEARPARRVIADVSSQVPVLMAVDSGREGLISGEGGIRTLERIAPLPVFKTGPHKSHSLTVLSELAEARVLLSG